MINRSDALFTYLLTDLGFPEGDPSPFATWQDYARSYLARDVYKKLLSHISDHADARALAKFISVNESCRDWRLECSGSWEDELVGSLREQIYKFWCPKGQPLVSSFAEVLDLARPGPGASIGATGNDFYTKMFSSLLTCTSSHLYDVYRLHFENHPLWASAETSRAAQYGDHQVVEGSRLSFVPKSNDISRTICIEPNLNMFYQLGFGAKLEERLRSYFGIDLATQPLVNRELARVGSISGDFATIDLSSASDSLSLKMLQVVLPRDLFAWLCNLRSQSVETPEGRQELHMVSTMGNGFTFPLQTMLFAAVVLTAMKYHGLRPKRSKIISQTGENRVDSTLCELGNWSVFGDDIIVPKRCFRTVIRLLELLGFRVNTGKTFVEGPFRESCGCDYFKGHDVRPVYIKSLDTQQDRYVAINLLNEWSARTGIPLPLTVNYLLGTVRYLPVPFSANQDSGVRVPYSLARDLLKHDANGAVLYSYRLAMPAKIKVLDGKLLYPKTMRRKQTMYNPDGLYLALLRGDLVRGNISVRHDRVVYRTARKVTPYWDYFPPAAGVCTPAFNWRQWNTAVHFNLTG